MTSEHARARAWRESLGLTRKELASLTGFSEGSILDFEGGPTRRDGRPIDTASWQRYRLVCAAIAHGHRSFDWES